MKQFRKFHRLRGTDKMSFPLNFISLDTETTTISDGEIEHYPSLKLGVCMFTELDGSANIVKDDWCMIRKTDDFYDYLYDKVDRYTDLTVYAHNWSFDMCVLNIINRLWEDGYTIKTIVDESPPVIMTFKKNQNTVTFIDTLNYFRMPLKAMGKALGVEKIDIDLETSDMYKLFYYCYRDTEIVKLSILKLIRFIYSNNLSKLTSTVSSLALNTFSRTFKMRDIYIDGNEERCKAGRASYFGGRTECFYIGKASGKFYMIDVNSQYPAAMVAYEYPTKTIRYYKRIDLEDVPVMTHKYCVTAHVEVNTNENYIPQKISGRTCFPIGRFDAHISTPELLYAYRNNHITKIHSVLLHEKGDIFSDYITYLYALRLRYKREGNKMYDLFTKLMMNSLYGKFGQQGKMWEETDEPRQGNEFKWSEIDSDLMRKVDYMYMSGQVFRCSNMTESMNSFPAIAAHVTAYARMNLYKTMLAAGQANVYYCDTDSLLLNQKGFDSVQHLIDPSKLGMWSLDDTFDNIDIRCPKDYKFGEKEKIKGVKNVHSKDALGRYKQLQFSSLKGSIGKGMFTAPLIRNITKIMKRQYEKGIVESTGIVRPFLLA